MKNVVAGTAGHIDHGKTALVKALTGIDADRLEEEKRRGITIDLGFAHMQLTPSLRLAFVDVPGHERFVKNMLAGVGGIDMALLVVAASESVKPQTREHFDICRLLGVPRGVIALTKADLVDGEILALARSEVEDLVAGSFLEGAPIVPVSAVTGAGLDELRNELARVAGSVPARDPAGWFRLPIDRVFSVKGAGVVVTGTLISGTVAREQEVEVYPSGRRLRVRGVEVHGSKVERAVAGQRTALNLADVEVSELARGDALSEPGRFRAVKQIDCRLALLRSAKPLKHRAPVHFHSGTAEIEAQVRLLGADGAGGVPTPFVGPPALALEPGAGAWVRIILRRPALLLPGDRFIIRSFSPVTTIGGGAVVDSGAGRQPGAFSRLSVLASADAAARIALLVRESKFGLPMRELVARTGMLETAIAAAAARAPVVVLAQPDPWYVDRAWFEAARQHLAQTVGEFHRANPLALGIGKEDLRARELPGAPAFLLDELLAHGGPILEGRLVRMPHHQVALKDDEEQARAAIERAFEQGGLATPALAGVLAQSGVEPARARSLLAILLREKKLVRIGEDLVFHQAAIQTLRAMLATRKPARFTVGDFKTWTGVSRKYAIPLLEYLDRERITRRDGDARVIL
jgi:selenocysteine-specific elongation factor